MKNKEKKMAKWKEETAKGKGGSVVVRPLHPQPPELPNVRQQQDKPNLPGGSRSIKHPYGGVLVMPSTFRWITQEQQPREGYDSGGSIIATSDPPPPSAVNHRRWIVASLGLWELKQQQKELMHLCNDLRLWNATIVIEPSLGRDNEEPEPPEYMGNCIILTVKRLNQLGFSSSRHVKGIAVKNLGYLYAISQNAEMILDLDMRRHKLTPEALDSQSLQNLNEFHCVQDVSSPTTNHINTCAHFGQPQLVPLGIETTKYLAENHLVYGHEPTSKQLVPIQQKMDASCPTSAADINGHDSSTRLSTVTAPLSLAPGNFGLLGGSNVLFHKSAFWALLLPNSLPSVDAHLVRGLWAQRLLWLMGGAIAFFPSSDIVVGPSNSNSLKGNEEGLSYCRMASSHKGSVNASSLVERLSAFLLHWRPSNTSEFTQSISELTGSLSTGEQIKEARHIWGKKNGLLTAWLDDLMKIGYNVDKEVQRVKKESKELHTPCTPEPVPPLWGEKTKKFAVLLVVAQKDYPFIEQVSQLEPFMDVFVSSWEERSSFYNSVMCKGCNWNQGRNKLLSLAMQMYRGYEYFIFSDDDVELVENFNNPTLQTGNAWLSFVRQLEKHRPPVAHPAFYWDPKLAETLVDKTKEVASIYWFDALFNAFHVDTISTLLPYVEEYDSESIWFSQVLLIHMANIIYPNQVLQFNSVAATNPLHRDYKKSMQFLKPETAVVQALLQERDRKEVITSKDDVWIREVPVRLSDDRFRGDKRQYLMSRSTLEARINNSSFIWCSKQRKENEMKASSEGIRKFYFNMFESAGKRMPSI